MNPENRKQLLILAGIVAACVLVVVLLVVLGSDSNECHDSPLSDRGFVCDFDE